MQVDIKKMFNNIAQNYDKLNNIISFGMHKLIKYSAINKIGIKSGMKILDICCGTGDISIYVAKNFDVNVIGVDFSENMLSIAENKARNFKNLKFLAADALELPFEDNEFDVCIISFGLRNLYDVEKALRGIKRVTKLNGKVVNIDTGKPVRLFEPIFNFYFFKIVPLMGRFFHKDETPYKYLPESTVNFPSPEKLVNIFSEIGFKNVKRYDYLFGTISQQIGEK